MLSFQKIKGAHLWRIQAKDLPLNEWFGLWLEEPMEDVNNQDGVCVEKTDTKVVCIFGSWIERQEFKPDDWIVITWFSWSEFLDFQI